MLQRHGFLCYFVFVQFLAAIVPSSAYFQTSVGGYAFSIPGYNDAERRTQVNAQTWCNGNQSKLLEITSGDIQSSIVSFINNAISLNQMTANSVITNGKRINLALTWVNGVTYSSSTSVKGQEPGFINSYGCLNSTQNGFDFVVDSPITTRGYICEGSSFCATGFTTNGRCYKSYSETLSWFDARNRCTDGKGDLASFDFIVDYNGFSALNGSGWNPPSSYWIGLARLKWTWQLSNSDVVYSQWSGGHPDYSTNQNNACLCLLPNTAIYDWKWSECDCNMRYQFVCMKESPSSTASSTSNRVVLTSTTTDATRSRSNSLSSVIIFRSTLSLSTAASERMTPANSILSDTSSVKAWKRIGTFRLMELRWNPKPETPQCTSHLRRMDKEETPVPTRNSVLEQIDKIVKRKEKTRSISVTNSRCRPYIRTSAFRPNSFQQTL